MAESFVLYGSPHSLFTYKVALMLRLSRQAFSFRYVSFQKKVNEAPWFRELSYWGQVPVLQYGDQTLVQSNVILEYLSEQLGSFGATGQGNQRRVREWLCWAADRLTPPVFNAYGVRLGELKLLPISVDPAVAAYHRRHGDGALDALDDKLAGRSFLVGGTPSVADVSCIADVVFAEICDFDVARRAHVAPWAARMRALPGFAEPFTLLAMEDREVPGG